MLYQIGDRVTYNINQFSWNRDLDRPRQGVITGFDFDYRFNSGADVEIRFDDTRKPEMVSLLFINRES